MNGSGADVTNCKKGEIRQLIMLIYSIIYYCSFADLINMIPLIFFLEKLLVKDRITNLLDLIISGKEDKKESANINI
jgi:hypothetical protein